MSDFRRVPRKLKKQIPVGVYCYKQTSGFKKLKDGRLGYTIEPCVFYKNVQCKDKPEKLQDEIDREYPEEWIGWCKLIKHGVDDQCKSCGLRYGKMK